MSNTERTLTKETEAVRQLLHSIRSEIDEDEQLKADMIEGETNLVEAIDQAAKRVQELAALQAGLKKTIDEMKERMTRFERNEERLRTAMLVAMGTAEVQKFELPVATISIRNGAPKVVILDENKLPTTYYVEQAPKLDKKKVNEDVKAGVKVPGTDIVPGEPTIAIKFK